MHQAKWGTTNDVFDFIGLDFFKRQNPVIFSLANSLMSKHTVCTEVLHTVQTTRSGLGTILAVGAFRWILNRQNCQHVVDEEVERERLDTFGGNWHNQLTSWANESSVLRPRRKKYVEIFSRVLVL